MKWVLPVQATLVHSRVHPVPLRIPPIIRPKMTDHQKTDLLKKVWKLGIYLLHKNYAIELVRLYPVN